MTLRLFGCAAAIIALAGCSSASVDGVGSGPSLPTGTPGTIGPAVTPGIARPTNASSPSAGTSSSSSLADFGAFCVAADQNLSSTTGSGIDDPTTINGLAALALANGNLGPVPSIASWVAAESSARELSRLAPDDPNVKPYAQRLVDDIQAIIDGDTSVGPNSAAAKVSGDAGAVHGWAVDHCPTNGVVTGIPTD